MVATEATAATRPATPGRSGHFIAVSGLPASGKTTLATRVAQALGLPLFDKDRLLEDLFARRGVGPAQWRRQLSGEADAALQRQVSATAGAVIASWWRHPGSTCDSGTPTRWLCELPGVLIELHCRCDPELAVSRFLARKRHLGHLDGRHSYATLLPDFVAQAALGPLALGAVLEVCSDSELDLSGLLCQLKEALDRSAPRLAQTWAQRASALPGQPTGTIGLAPDRNIRCFP